MPFKKLWEDMDFMEVYWQIKLVFRYFKQVKCGDGEIDLVCSG